jgi:hypothetical protein
VTNRRRFLRTVAGTVAGGYVMGRGLLDVGAQAPDARRRVTIGNRRIRVVDIHAHWEMAESPYTKNLLTARPKSLLEPRP